MGRKAKPWYRKSHGAWYATIRGERTHLVTGPHEETEAQAHEEFRRLAQAAVDPSVERVVDMLRDRPELIPAVLWVVEGSNWLDVLRKSVPGYPALYEREKALVEVMLATAVRAGLTPDQVRAAGRSLARLFDEPGIEVAVADTESVRGWIEDLLPAPRPSPEKQDGTAGDQQRR